MTLTELYRLRDEFWRINKSYMVTFKTLIEDPGDGSTLPASPERLLDGCDTFLESLSKLTSDEELRADILVRRKILGARLNRPFSHL